MDCEKGGHLTDPKFDCGSQKDIAMEEWPNLPMYTEQHEFGVKRHASAYTCLILARLPLDTAFYTTHFVRNDIIFRICR